MFRFARIIVVQNWFICNIHVPNIINFKVTQKIPNMHPIIIFIWVINNVRCIKVLIEMCFFMVGS